MQRAILAGGAALLVATAVAAGDIRVQYDVDAKSLKKGLRGDGELRFDVYDDPDCDDRIDRQDIDAVDLVIEEIKTRKLKGGPKVPRRARITAVLEDVPEADAYFLDVFDRNDDETIVPLGGSCQGQTAGAPGPQGPPGSFSTTDCERVDGPVVDNPDPLALLTTDLTLTVDCGPGQRVIGGGLSDTNDPVGQSCSVIRSEPKLDLSGWVVRVVAAGGICGGAFFATAICCGP